MSDPVTNVQIEDVLSSIRRLVSTNDRPEAEAEGKQDDAPEKLVLTPSLRVTESDYPADNGAETQDDTAEDTDWAADALDDLLDDQQDDDQQDTADQDQDQDHPEQDEPEQVAEADDGNPVQDVWADEDHSHDEPDEDSHDDSYEDDQADADDDWHSQGSTDENTSSDDQEHESTSDTDDLTARVAGFEDAVAARDDAWDPEVDSDDDNAAQPMERLHWDADENDDGEDVDNTDNAGDVDVEEAEIVSANEGLEPFVPEEDIDLTPELEQVIDNATATAAAATNAFAGSGDPLGDDAAILDEEALRDLVTDIVREELQGALGERITRNVRKLVRREIHRALTTRELE